MTSKEDRQILKYHHYKIREGKANIFLLVQVTGGLKNVLHSVPLLSAQIREECALAAALPKAADGY